MLDQRMHIIINSSKIPQTNTVPAYAILLIFLPLHHAVVRSQGIHIME
jgi:hypothetical protein